MRAADDKRLRTMKHRDLVLRELGLRHAEERRGRVGGLNTTEGFSMTVFAFPRTLGGFETFGFLSNMCHHVCETRARKSDDSA